MLKNLGRRYLWWGQSQEHHTTYRLKERDQEVVMGIYIKLKGREGVMVIHDKIKNRFNVIFLKDGEERIITFPSA